MPRHQKSRAAHPHTVTPKTLSRTPGSHRQTATRTPSSLSRTVTLATNSPSAATHIYTSPFPLPPTPYTWITCYQPTAWTQLPTT